MPITVAELKSLTPEQLEKVRHACKTDLWFLYNEILRNPRNRKELPLSEKCHRPIIDNFVKKDPSKSVEDQSPIKVGLFLSARGTLKTTLDAADCVQWILCFPDIRIVILSGKLAHASEMVGLVTKYFQENELLRFLFPTWCPSLTAKLPSDKFECPARTIGIVQRGSTIAIGSTESGWAGAHGEVLKLDDFENEKNTATPELRQGRIDDYDDLDPVLEPFGYIDVLGTLWGEDDDLYCELLKRNEKWVSEGNPPEMRIVRQPVWKLKDGVKLKNVKREDVEWLIWEKLNVGNLVKQARANPKKFSRQYMMEIAPSESLQFPLSLLERQTRPASECPLPHRSWSFQNWDLAGTSGKHGNDFTVGINAVIEDTTRCFALDSVMERFDSPTAQATAIVMFAKKWNPLSIRIEESQGARNLEPTIMTIAKREKVNMPIVWEPPSHEKDAKIIRISTLEPAMREDKVQIFAGFPDKDDLIRQLLRHPNPTKHDDVADCLAQLWEYFHTKVFPLGIQALQASPDGDLDWILQKEKNPEMVTVEGHDEPFMDGMENILSEGLSG